MNEDKEMMELVEVENNYEPEEEKGHGIGKFIVGGVIGGAVALGTIAYIKGKDKIEEHKIRKLEKKGYVVYRPGEVEDVEEVYEETEEEK